MRLEKFMLIVIAATAFSLIYVYQQTEIFRLAYDGQKNTKKFQALLDTNSNLRYSFKQKTSLVSIGNKISGQDFTMPENYCLVKLDPAYSLVKADRPVKRETMVSKLFNIKRQAEAKTLGSPLTFGLNSR
ncbi:MAG: hypothetical protein ACM3OC_05085 [Deltaproteobacteria bacterium]